MKYFLMGILFFMAAFSQAKVELQGVQNQKDKNYSYYFGRVPVHSMRANTFRLTNTSETTVLEIKQMTISGSMFRAQTNCPLKMQPKETCLIRAFFTPYWEGYFVGDLDISFENDDDISVALSGSGTRY